MSNVINQVWQPIAEQLISHLLNPKVKVVGVSGAQGSGKSTFSSVLAQALGVDCVVASLDDYYLTKSQRSELAAQVHPLLQTRGVPGTHDTQALGELMQRFAIHRGPQKVEVLQFDKGLDDRVASCTQRGEMLIVEGWCLGVEPQPQAALETTLNELEQQHDQGGLWRQWVNAQIEQHYLPLWQQVDFWVHLRVPSFAQVYAWRAQQEQAIPEAQRMSAQALKQFVQHYERLSCWQIEFTQHSPLSPGCFVDLSEDHTPQGITFTKK